MKAMPSPNGTNKAGLFISGRVEAAYDAIPMNGLEILKQKAGNDSDDEFGPWLLSFLAGKLDEADLETIRGVMAGEVEAPTNGEMASDEQIMRRRRRYFDRGQISYDALHAPIVRPQSPADAARFAEMFPHAHRLK